MVWSIVISIYVSFCPLAYLRNHMAEFYHVSNNLYSRPSVGLCVNVKWKQQICFILYILHSVCLFNTHRPIYFLFPYRELSKNGWTNQYGVWMMQRICGCKLRWMRSPAVCTLQSALFTNWHHILWMLFAFRPIRPMWCCFRPMWSDVVISRTTCTRLEVRKLM